MNSTAYAALLGRILPLQVKFTGQVQQKYTVSAPRTPSSCRTRC